MAETQDSERPVNIASRDGVEKLSNPSPEDLEDLGKHELGLLATYY